MHPLPPSAPPSSSCVPTWPHHPTASQQLPPKIVKAKGHRRRHVPAGPAGIWFASTVASTGSKKQQLSKIRLQDDSHGNHDEEEEDEPQPSQRHSGRSNGKNSPASRAALTASFASHPCWQAMQHELNFCTPNMPPHMTDPLERGRWLRPYYPTEFALLSELLPSSRPGFRVLQPDHSLLVMVHSIHCHHDNIWTVDLQDDTGCTIAAWIQPQFVRQEHQQLNNNDNISRPQFIKQGHVWRLQNVTQMLPTLPQQQQQPNDDYDDMMMMMMMMEDDTDDDHRQKGAMSCINRVLLIAQSNVTQVWTQDSYKHMSEEDFGVLFERRSLLQQEFQKRLSMGDPQAVVDLSLLETSVEVEHEQHPTASQYHGMDSDCEQSEVDGFVDDNMDIGNHKEEDEVDDGLDIGAPKIVSLHASSHHYIQREKRPRQQQLTPRNSTTVIDPTAVLLLASGDSSARSSTSTPLGQSPTQTQHERQQPLQEQSRRLFSSRVEASAARNALNDPTRFKNNQGHQQRQLHVPMQPQRQRLQTSDQNPTPQPTAMPANNHGPRRVSMTQAPQPLPAASPQDIIPVTFSINTDNRNGPHGDFSRFSASAATSVVHHSDDPLPLPVPPPPYRPIVSSRGHALRDNKRNSPSDHAKARSDKQTKKAKQKSQSHEMSDASRKTPSPKQSHGNKKRREPPSARVTTPQEAGSKLWTTLAAAQHGAAGAQSLWMLGLSSDEEDNNNEDAGQFQSAGATSSEAVATTHVEQSSKAPSSSLDSKSGSNLSAMSTTATSSGKDTIASEALFQAACGMDLMGYLSEDEDSQAAACDH